MYFKPTVRTLAKIPCSDRSFDKHEKTFRGASLEFVLRDPGTLTRRFIRYLQRRDWFDCPLSDVVIDSRMTMLKPGWHPSIPGWHMDEIIRHPETNQPMAFEVDRHGPRHALVCFDMGTGSRTEFILPPNDECPGLSLRKEDCDRHVADGGTVWSFFDKLASLATGYGVPTYTVRSGEVVEFGWGDIHRAIPATGSGFRLFIRATKRSRRKHRNEINTQSQVYLTNPSIGW